MTFAIQQCSPKADLKIAWEHCQHCNGCGWADPMLALDKCDACQGAGRWTGVSVGIQEAPTHEGAYPYVALLPGQCFCVPFDVTKEKTVRNRTSTQNKVDNRKFIVIKHAEFNCYEVARVK